MPDLIYLDHAATTPLRPEARAAMEPFLAESYANPSSIYRLAQSARAALDAARDSIAECLGVSPAEIVFTGGGTESDNAAIKGAALARRDAGRHLVTTAIEHHAVLHPMEELEQRFGFDLTIVPAGRDGVVDPGTVEGALRPDTVLVSVMWANNEIGTVQPVAEIGALLRGRGVTFHVDAVQAAESLAIDLRSTPADLLSLSAHKFYGPKGVGALYIRRGTPWWPLLTGGGQERNRRAGTENVAGIVAMARALELACAERAVVTPHIQGLRDYLLSTVPARIPGTTINGDARRRLPNNVNFSFDGVHGESLLVGLDLAGIMASSGSACTSGSLEPSHVLRAIGLPDSLARASLRLTLGRENTMAELERTVEVLERLVTRLRSLAPAAGRA
ncbi:MAG: cysteine desulfurase [Chloroflexi bacterium]|nr:cysteine desulfurase [Chloroflexota bacterium]